MGRPIDIVRKGWESSIHDDDIDLCVNLVRRVDVPDSDRCDFRRLRAVGISSLLIRFSFLTLIII